MGKSSIHCRLRDPNGQLAWVSSQGKCIFDQQGETRWFPGVLAASNGEGKPLMPSGQAAGLIGVDHSRYAIQDDVQIRNLAGFLMARFCRGRKERQEEQS